MVDGGPIVAVALGAAAAVPVPDENVTVTGVVYPLPPLPLTDAIIRPQDGAMYFTVGGRRTQSALYRVTYAGAESTAPAAPLPVTPEAKERHELENGDRDQDQP